MSIKSLKTSTNNHQYVDSDVISRTRLVHTNRGWSAITTKNLQMGLLAGAALAASGAAMVTSANADTVSSVSANANSDAEASQVVDNKVATSQSLANEASANNQEATKSNESEVNAPVVKEANTSVAANTVSQVKDANAVSDKSNEVASNNAAAQPKAQENAANDVKSQSNVVTQPKENAEVAASSNQEKAVAAQSNEVKPTAEVASTKVQDAPKAVENKVADESTSDDNIGNTLDAIQNSTYYTSAQKSSLKQLIATGKTDDAANLPTNLMVRNDGKTQLFISPNHAVYTNFASQPVSNEVKSAVNNANTIQPSSKQVGNFLVLNSIANNGTTQNSSSRKVLLNIADYGARANDPNFNNAPIISRLINDLPKSGGTILIPEGDYYIKSPIKVNHSFVTIQGTNDGWRSGVDKDNNNGQSFGGSHLVLVGSGDAIDVQSPDSNRITGCSFQNFSITGSNSQGTGINVLSDNDHFTISGMAFRGLDTPIKDKGADAIQIVNNIVAENKNGIALTGASQQAIIEGNSIGAQPGGSSLFMENPGMYTISGNTIYPDGKQNILLYNPVHGTITGNTITSYGTGLITMLSSKGNDSDGDFGNCNTITGNTLIINKWNGGYGYDNKWGVMHIDGFGNTIAGNTLEMDACPDNTTGILIMHGNDNMIAVNNIDPLHKDNNARVVINGSCNANSVIASTNQAGFQDGNNSSNKLIMALPDPV